MHKKTLYQKDSFGNTLAWQIYISEDNGICLVVNHGRLGGSIQTDVTPIIKGLGGKTCYEQAVCDLNTEVNRKIKSGYVEDISKIKSKEETRTIKKPSKGEVYTTGIRNPFTHRKGYSLAQAKMLNTTVGIQPKLDGWRFRILVSKDNEVTYYTSSGDIVRGFFQITNEILLKIQKFRRCYGLEDVLLDGEIYNHEMKFEEIESACSTSKNFTPSIMALRDRLKFYLFDIVNMESRYYNRWASCEVFNGEYIVQTPMDIVLGTDKNIQEKMEHYLLLGYEGLIIRNLNKQYEHKKSKQFLKYKPIIDAEFIVIGFNESIKTNTLGSLVLEMPDGKTFDCMLKDSIGTEEFKKHIWNNKEKYIYSPVTVQFLEYTNLGVPRNPRAKCFRNKKDIS